MKRIMVYIDEDAVEESIDLLEVARRIYGKGGYRSYALAVGGGWKDAASWFDVVFRLRNTTLPNYEIAAVARCMADLHRGYSFDVILVPATMFGRMIAPRAAVRLKAGLVADVTEVSGNGDVVVMVRPAFSGRMVASVLCRGSGPIMMSLRPRNFIYGDREKKTAEAVEIVPSDHGDSGIRLIERRNKEEVGDIRKSEVLVSGGGGILKDFSLLDKLAKALNGMVAASRRAVDGGTAPRGIQVGQSGKIVSPRLYIALGISGSAQHMAGLKNAECVISVNTNRYAPICSLSDILVEGDAREFVKGLLARIEAIETKE